MELAFAGLHQLCAPMLDRLTLPAPQRTLWTAFGLTAGTPPDRFLVGLAVLSLLSEVAERAAADVRDRRCPMAGPGVGPGLAFVARRLLAEPVAVVFAVREPGTRDGPRAAGAGVAGWPTSMPGRCWTRRSPDA